MKIDETVEQQTTSPETEAPVTPPPAPDLNLNDLAAIRNLIDVVTQRGVFKANELSSAGALYDKLTAFLNAAQAQTQAPQQPAQEPTA